MKRLLQLPTFCLVLLVSGCSIPSRDVRNAQEPLDLNILAKSTENFDVNYITRAVQQVGPAVVRIDSTRTVAISPDPVIERFFPGQFPTREEEQQGLGSGFITTADGLIFTNAHVVADADKVTVLLKDGRSFEGEVVGADSVTDVAVVKIAATELPIVKLGNSDNLMAGEPAIAIGNPLGLDNTVTQGIISATQRSVAGLGVPAERVDFIQTDAAINPGNSGGPLLNAQGEVIGMNTAIIQGAQGLGFAIPINTAQRIAAQLIEKGRVDHPYIGIQMAQLSPELREKINQSDAGIKITQDTGVIVLGVVRNSPASRAGMRPGDIIESINNVAIQDIKQVQQQVEDTNIGESMQITINRDGSRQQITVQPEALPTK
ncbi:MULTISPECIES: HhoA/HhoB/HtrA family serine endopeptidase [Cyanophyceae]|uniref:HhoA/HhoB/HtrA family serine endopeptidase n=1 Tax=Cyanophyceae TaxID=3028117 RepID=UPI00232B2DA6|nr:MULTISPECIES: HhoA/HhoB/HtrA family serine endopeptidase [Cyanophyceae]MDB9356625.1 trypsin-like peptidase domain-containing protein [Nodularia spumigena CS-587/03]MDB9303786.1 trypsin-like peptidase domain-containing protein [Nodularia spumigena CS-591/12]MDB9341441.1 trypsin-like peptidase domain-containing protein [Nodularia spumigena CS-589/07]MDB9398564.1 trypsin-like peptidase domain-containing protein [Microcystis aeruginosa CS-567/02-A1]MDB9497990.1 trypsin-like peptidase domain-con